MTKQLKSSIPVRRHRDDRGRFIKAPAQVVTEAPKAPAPAVDPSIILFRDLKKVNGVLMLEKSAYKALRAEYQDYVNEALDAVVHAHKAGLTISLAEGLILVSAPGFRWHQISQLAAVDGNRHFLEVLKWVYNNPGKGLFKEYPSRGYPGIPKTLGKNLGKADALLIALQKVRTDGQKPSIGSLKYLAKMAKLLGWIK